MAGEISATSLLSRMAELAAAAAGTGGPGALQRAPEDFAAVVRGLLDQVNQAQTRASDLSQAFELEEPNADLAQVMIAREQARVAFEAVLQVRNRMVQAYQEIMNMPM
jgi:flagellar hook-basal body complex protein FliE